MALLIDVMSYRKVFVLLILFVSLTACAGKHPKLWVSSKVVDFGEIPRFPVIHTSTLEITNKGKDILYIEDVRSSCTCVYTKPSKRIIHRGDKVSLHIELNTKLSNYGPFEQKVALYTNANESPTYIKIIGVVIKNNENSK